MSEKISRRDFISKSATGVGLVSLKSLEVLEKDIPKEASDELPKRMLGRTGRMVSCIGFGGGGRYWRDVANESTAEELVNYAVKLGITYFDSAKDYGNSKTEKRYGRYLTPKYRKQIFLTSKTQSRTYDEIMKDVETSLKNLNTDYLDLYCMHGIDKIEDVETLSGPSGGYKAYIKLKNEGVAKNIGFSFHKWNDASKESLKRFDPDAVLCVINASRDSGCEQYFLPLALVKNIGVIAIKTTGASALIGNVTGQDLVRYALSLPIALASIGMESYGTLESCVSIAKEPLISPEKREEIVKKLAFDPKVHKLPYFR
jgi:aryl-alcohol dehydrogenase-like predicted oxidoreductase